MKYQESKIPQKPTVGNFQNMQNLSAEERQARIQQFGAAGAGVRGMRMPGGEFLSGEIIAKDAGSITIKLLDVGSKIVFFSDSTDITKPVGGSRDDLKEGQQIMITGEENPDGSYTAKTIQLRSQK